MVPGNSLWGSWSLSAVSGPSPCWKRTNCLDCELLGGRRGSIPRGIGHVHVMRLGQYGGLAAPFVWERGEQAAPGLKSMPLGIRAEPGLGRD